MALVAWMFDPARLGATLGSSLLYVSNWTAAAHADHGLTTGLLTPTWSLSIEEQFYLVWPFLLATLLHAGGRRAALSGTLVMAGAIAIHRTTVTTLGHASLGTDARADALLIGSALALAWSLGLVRPGRVARRLGAIAGALLCVLAVFHDTEVVGWHQVADGGYTLIAIAAATVVLGALSGGGPLTWRPLVHVGRISYGLYLYHYPIERVLQDRLGSGGMCLALTLVVTFGVAGVSYRYIEAPFLQLKRGPLRRELAVATP